MIGKLLCVLGFHKWNDRFVGLLYRQCERCGKIVKVADPYTYKPGALKKAMRKNK